MPERIQRRRAKGWKLPPNTVIVTRPTKWGNPFTVGRDGTVEECLKLFVDLCAGSLCISREKAVVVAQRRTLRAIQHDISQLKSKDLACFCRPDQLCHADVLLALANGDETPMTWIPILKGIDY